MRWTTIRHLPPPFYSCIPCTLITCRYSLYTSRKTCFFASTQVYIFIFIFFEFLSSVRTNFDFLSGGRSGPYILYQNHGFRVRTFFSPPESSSPPIFGGPGRGVSGQTYIMPRAPLPSSRASLQSNLDFILLLDHRS